MFLYDAHNHLCDPRLEPIRGEILQELEGINLRAAVVNSSGEAEWEPLSKLASKHSWIIPAFGIHPWNVHRARVGWQARLLALLEAHPNATVGEIGLDRWIRDYDINLQREVFSWQLALAAERDLPVTIHCLKTWGLLLEILQSSPLPKRGFLLHSYSGPQEMVVAFSKLGARFSFSPYFLHERKAAQREIFSRIAADRLLVETDAPDMWPPDERNPHPLHEADSRKPLNHPLNIEVAYAGLAEVRQVPVEDLADQVEANFKQLFVA